MIRKGSLTAQVFKGGHIRWPILRCRLPCGQLFRQCIRDITPVNYKRNQCRANLVSCSPMRELPLLNVMAVIGVTYIESLEGSATVDKQYRGGAEAFDTIRSDQEANAKVQLARPRAGELTVVVCRRIVWSSPLLATVGRTGMHAWIGCHSCTRVLRE